ncbi:hypothetical protein HWV62_44157 [Athelia sp. TMB]|nr:hypothetical protein HWV62_44157 [Athelia sp. TMB]
MNPTPNGAQLASTSLNSNTYPRSSSGVSSSSSISSSRLESNRFHLNEDSHWTNPFNATPPECDSQRRFSFEASLAPSIPPLESLHVDHGSPSYRPTMRNQNQNWAEAAVDRDGVGRFATSDSRNGTRDHLEAHARMTLHPQMSIPFFYQSSGLPGGAPPSPSSDYQQAIRASIAPGATSDQYSSSYSPSPGPYHLQHGSYYGERWMGHSRDAAVDSPGHNRNINAPLSYTRSDHPLLPFPTASTSPPAHTRTIMAPTSSKPRMARATTVNPPPPAVLPVAVQTTPQTRSEAIAGVDSSEALPAAEFKTGKGNKKHACWMCHKSFDRPRHVKRCAIMNMYNVAPSEPTRDHPTPPASAPSATPAHVSPAAIPAAAPTRAPKRKGPITPPTTPFGNSNSHPSGKRHRRAPSPSQWLPPSLQGFIICPPQSAGAAVTLPLPPVFPCAEGQEWDWSEERDSWATGVSDTPYHPTSGWSGTLPGPALHALKRVKEDLKISDGGRCMTGIVVL